MVEHADAATVKGKNVIGVLPLWLASEAALVTEAKLDIPVEYRGIELTSERVADFFQGFNTYQVSKV